MIRLPTNPIRLSGERCDIRLCCGFRPLSFGFSVDLWIRLVNGVGKCASFFHNAMLENHERHVGITGGMCDRCEFLGASETFGGDVHTGATIQHRFKSGVQTRLRKRDRCVSCGV